MKKYELTNETISFYGVTLHAPTDNVTNLGSRLCFKSNGRAAQFAKQFIDLYNKVFL